MSIAVPSILYFVFYFFSEIQAHYYALVQKTYPLERTTLDEKLWLEPPLAYFTIPFAFAARIAGFVFLVYFGYHTRWYYPILLFIVCLPLVVVVATIIRALFGYQIAALLGFLIIPIAGVGMYLAV